MHHFISFLLRIAYAAGFGYILFFHTSDIVRYLPKLMGGLLMLETVGQLLELFLLKVKTTVSWAFFIVPLLVLLYALYLIFFETIEIDPYITLREVFNPIGGFNELTIKIKMVGFWLVAFVISELVISIVFFKPLYMPKKFAEQKAKEREAQRLLEEEQARIKAQEAQSSTKETANN